MRVALLKPRTRSSNSVYPHMRALIQRVTRANVSIAGDTDGAAGATVGHIDRGLCVLACAMQNDDDADADFIADKLANLRIFPDDAGRFDRSVLDIDGAILLISQFTLAADTRKGRRPSFSLAAAPEPARQALARLTARLQQLGLRVEHGAFGEHMHVELINDGPVTIWLDSREGGRVNG